MFQRGGGTVGLLESQFGKSLQYSLEDPLCLMWCIWRERNSRSFEDCERTTIELKAIVFKSLYVWMSAYNNSRSCESKIFFFFFFFFSLTWLADLGKILAFFNHFGLSWVMSSRLVDLFECWWMGGSSHGVVVSKMVPSCLLWCLWREISDQNF
jgi:hypothetical protein